MDDRDVFDKLLQVCAGCTGSQDTYLKVVESVGGWDVVAVDSAETETLVGSFPNEVDADWHALITQTFPDLWRWLHAAGDEAERADLQRDEQEQVIAQQALEIQSLRKELTA